MKAQEAVRIAKDFVAELFAEEDPINIGLEELEYDRSERSWMVTVGFSRPWNVRSGLIPGATPPDRAYKRVVVGDDGQVTAIRHEELEA